MCVCALGIYIFMWYYICIYILYLYIYTHIYIIYLCDIVPDFFKGIQCNCGPVGNFATCCIPSRAYMALVIRFHFYRYDRIVNS